MKPVVSSLVALAIAVTPFGVMAKPASKSAHAKVVKHKVEKSDKADKDDATESETTGERACRSEKADKVDKSEKTDRSEKADRSEPAVVRVKAVKKHGASVKNVVHHAHNVDLGGAGHKEPKVEHGVLVTASMKTPSSHGKAHLKTASAKTSDVPKLPNPNAGKPSKGGAEKGARKPAEKKAESGDDGAGEPARDEESAELVAPNHGHSTASSRTAHADEEKSEDGARDAKVVKAAPQKSKAPCVKDPVEVVRGPEVERFELTKCDGKIAPLAVEHLSILIRPGGAARPTTPVAELAKKPGPELARGVRRVDPRLVDRIQSVVDHFGKPGAPAKLFIISGYRPASVGSMHSTGRAIDFRVEGVTNEEVVSFCKTLADTGCGFYPNSSFVHIDVRDAGAGQVTWIDASGPGETPRYVSVWPPAPESAQHLHRASTSQSTEELAEEGEKLLRARRPLEHETTSESIDEHPAEAVH